MSTDNPEDLNYDCNYNMFLAKTQLQNLANVKDRQKAAKWMKKLAMSNNSVREMKLRNDFMYYLVLNIQNSELKEPFINDPPVGTIMDIANKLPHGAETAAGLEAASAWGAGSEAENLKRPFLYANSPDGGAFLASQPTPRCGAFCYLAVVSKPRV